MGRMSFFTVGKWRAAVVTGMMGLALSFSAGCDSNDSEDASSSESTGASTATVTGNIASFSASKSAETRWFAKPLTNTVSEISGVVISVAGTTLTATTDSGGSFTLSGVPTGEVELSFVSGTSTVTYRVVVPEGSVVRLKNITISGNTITVERVEIEYPDSTSKE